MPVLPIPELVLLELHFKTLLPINNLSHYHGAQWSALFRTLLKGYFPDEPSVAQVKPDTKGFVSASNPPLEKGGEGLSGPQIGGFSGDTSMSLANIWIHPIETGLLSYEKDEPIHLGLTFPVEYAPTIFAMLNDFNTIQGGEGHFQPGKTVSLEEIICRISGEPWEPSTDVPYLRYPF